MFFRLPGVVADGVLKGREGDRVNFNQLEWFCRAYELRSFAKAAERTYVSRQALGKAIRSLEAGLGVTLFTRTDMGVTPTQAAEVIYPLACRCLSDARSIERRAREASGDARESLRFVVANGVVECLPDDFFERFERENPRADISVDKHFYARCLDLLREGSADFALCPGSLVTPDFSRTVLVRQRLYVACHESLIDFPIEDCSLEDLAALPFFSVGERESGMLGLSRLFDSCGLATHIIEQYTEYGIILAKMRSGQGAVLVPEHEIARARGDGVAIFPFPKGLLEWEIVFLYRADELSDAKQGIVQFMQRNACSD